MKQDYRDDSEDLLREWRRVQRIESEERERLGPLSGSDWVVLATFVGALFGAAIYLMGVI